MLAIASGLDESGDAEEGEVMADGGLTLAEAIAEGADVKFPFAEEVHQDTESGFVREELEDLDEFFFEFGGQFGEEGGGIGLFRGFQKLRRHSISLRFRRESTRRSVLLRIRLPRLMIQECSPLPREEVGPRLTRWTRTEPEGFAIASVDWSWHLFLV